MKKIKQYTIFFFSIFSLLLTFGCNDWLDVDRLGSMTENEVFSDENNINAVMNGFYSEMAGSNLYGGHLALTTIEYLGHYYYYPANTPLDPQDSNNKIREYYWLGKYNYSEDAIKNRFSPIWNKGYELILSLNIFIEKVKETEVINERKKNLLLGEAYGLRAFLHFDLFRLFGPIYSLDEAAESIPYNDESTVNSNLPYLPARQFIEKLLADIETAKEYLSEDPILTEGVKDEEDSNLTQTEAFHTIFRNRRFNYHAVNAFKARVLLYKGDHQEAGKVALEVITNTQNNEELKLFKFVPHTSIVNNLNYICYNEVIFGLHNIRLTSTWEGYMRNREVGKVHSVSNNNLTQNIFPDPNFTTSNDYRTRQWKLASSLTETGLWFSYKYRTETLPNDNPIKNHQPLIRISEMYYILAEAYLEAGNLPLAAETIYKVQYERGIQEEENEAAITMTSSAEDLWKLLEREYYKEFFAEGQVFFFHKRRNSEFIFNGYGSGYSEIVPENYVVPMPKSETDL